MHRPLIKISKQRFGSFLDKLHKIRSLYLQEIPLKQIVYFFYVEQKLFNLNKCLFFFHLPFFRRKYLVNNLILSISISYLCFIIKEKELFQWQMTHDTNNYFKLKKERLACRDGDRF